MGAEVSVELTAPFTIARLLDAVEGRYPMLRGTIREFETGRRRPFLRFFACEEDFSLEPLDTRLPAAVIEGREPFILLGAIAGG